MAGSATSPLNRDVISLLLGRLTVTSARLKPEVRQVVPALVAQRSAEAGDLFRGTLEQLQLLLDEFADEYNNRRPHRLL